MLCGLIFFVLYTKAGCLPEALKNATPLQIYPAFVFLYSLV